MINNSEKDLLDNPATEELLEKLSLKEGISSNSPITTPNKNVERKIILYTPFFKEQMEETIFHTPLSPQKCKSSMSLNYQQHNASSVVPKKLDFSSISINKKKRKRGVDSNNSL